MPVCRFILTFLNDGNESKITIGDNCVFASGISVIDRNGHELYSKDRIVGRDTPKSIRIGNMFR